jgi:lipopolysaccharide transport system ATP-binding protein
MTALSDPARRTDRPVDATGPSTSALSVSGLGKTYTISHADKHTTRITEAVGQRLRHPFRKPETETFDALEDVSFEIPWGEAVGIVGRNGAGKSTLLKLLTRITAPSRGRIELGGRIGSLLEVGTGFHPELTGRENIFLNGALLGMRKKEIVRRFDEIVDFSGVEKFLDTPVKRYSSGMYVRLAFSVAAHLDTELLAIDEVLAVGDAEFQARSLAKMRDVARDGRTVLYVSHQAQTVTSLCTSAMFLDRGRLAYHGSVEGALKRYRDSFETFRASQTDPAKRSGTGDLRFTEAEVLTTVREPVEPTVIDFAVGPNRDFAGQYYVACHVNDAQGNVVIQADSRLLGQWYDPDREQRGRVTIDGVWLKPGRYTVDLYVCGVGVMDAWEGVGSFEVLPVTPYPEISTEDALAHGIVLADFRYDERR